MAVKRLTLHQIYDSMLRPWQGRRIGREGEGEVRGWGEVDGPRLKSQASNAQHQAVELSGCVELSCMRAHEQGTTGRP